MNILFLATTLPRFENDSQAPFVLEQAIAWKKARPADQVLILAPHDHLAKQYEEIEGVCLYRFVYFWPRKWQKLVYPAILPNIKNNPLLLIQLPFLIISEFSMAIKLIKQHHINMLFGHWIMPQGLVCYLVKKIYKIPYCLKNYSSDLRVFRKIPVLGPILAKKIIRSSNVLICENERLKNEALDFFKNSEHKEMESKIAPLCLGVTNLEEPNSTNIASEFKYDLGFIGRLSKKKGVPYLIEALLKFKAQNDSCRTVIAGDGEEKSHLKNLCASESNIDFVGFVSKEKKLELFRQTKFFVFPSFPSKGDIEGMPVAMLEALYLGKIVIASRDTNIELLPDWPKIQECVFLLKNPQDTEEFISLLKKLISLTDEEIQSKSEVLKSVMKEYDWDKYIHRYISLISGRNVQP